MPPHIRRWAGIMMTILPYYRDRFCGANMPGKMRATILPRCGFGQSSCLMQLRRFRYGFTRLHFRRWALARADNTGTIFSAQYFMMVALDA